MAIKRRANFLFNALKLEKPDLSICCLAVYVNCDLTGETWSISPAFTPKPIDTGATQREQPKFLLPG